MGKGVLGVLYEEPSGAGTREAGGREASDQPAETRSNPLIPPLTPHASRLTPPPASSCSPRSSPASTAASAWRRSRLATSRSTAPTAPAPPATAWAPTGVRPGPAAGRRAPGHRRRRGPVRAHQQRVRAADAGRPGQAAGLLAGHAAGGLERGGAARADPRLAAPDPDPLHQPDRQDAQLQRALREASRTG